MTIDIKASFKKRIIVLLALLSIYTAFGLSLNMEETSGNEILSRFDKVNMWTKLYANFMISLRHPKTSTVIYGFLAKLPSTITVSPSRTEFIGMISVKISYSLG